MPAAEIMKDIFAVACGVIESSGVGVLFEMTRDAIQNHFMSLCRHENSKWLRDLLVVHHQFDMLVQVARQELGKKVRISLLSKR